MDDETASPRFSFRSFAAPLVIAVLVIGALVWLAILADRREQRERESARLEAISDLRAGQVANWLRDKLAQARFAGNSPLGELYLRWHVEGDSTARDRLMDRLASFHKASGAHSVLLLDAGGAAVASDPPTDQPVAPELKAAALRAVESGQPQFTQLYGSADAGPALRLDVVAPLTLSGQPARGVIVVRLDPEDHLFPLLAQWPLPSRTATTLLVRKQGAMLVGARGLRPVSLNEPNLLAARVLRGEEPFGRAFEAMDFRGKPALGVVRPVDGTDWYLVAKMDSEEVYADARRHAVWLVGAGLLALLAGGAAAFGWREHRARLAARIGHWQRESERLRLEALVQQRTAELAEKNRALERTVGDLEAFSASVSHDLRGPLHTISGFATMLSRSESGQLSDSGRQKLSRIIEGASSMDRMIGDILRCSRAERVELHFRHVDLEELVSDLLHELSPGYPRTRVKRTPLPAVWADPTLTGQIFTNLIGNAFKFSAKQDQPVVEVGAEPGADGEPEFFVRDNGVGFDPARKDRLFRAFERLHDQSQFPGTGVGLAIVKRLVERHGGRIEATSEPGVCTEFRFRFGSRPPEA
jgi:signal transduction histidine kinase